MNGRSRDFTSVAPHVVCFLHLSFLCLFRALSLLVLCLSSYCRSHLLISHWGCWRGSCFWQSSRNLSNSSRGSSSLPRCPSPSQHGLVTSVNAIERWFCDFTLVERIDELIYTRWMLSMHVNTDFQVWHARRHVRE